VKDIAAACLSQWGTEGRRSGPPFTAIGLGYAAALPPDHSSSPGLPPSLWEIPAKLGFVATKPRLLPNISSSTNSPEPDHIYLWKTTGQFVDFIVEQGYDIEGTQFLPMTGYSLERAERQKLSISCVVIAVNPGA
jgi:hypothetical protein